VDERDGVCEGVEEVDIDVVGDRVEETEIEGDAD